MGELEEGGERRGEERRGDVKCLRTRLASQNQSRSIIGTKSSLM